MRVAILGAGGTIAPAIVRDLAESTETESLLLLDRDESQLARAVSASGLATDGHRLATVDATDAPALAKALEGCDVLVNSASYRVNLDAMSACLLAGCHYLDLGGLYWMTGRQLELGPRFEDAGLLALLGIGSAPGKTNLMAARAVRELGGDVDALHVSAAGRDLDPPPGFSVPYALQTLLDEVIMRPVILRGGVPEELEPLSDGGTVEFGEPFGAAKTIHTLHSELRTFAESFGCHEASFRLSLPANLLSRLRELAGAPEPEIRRAEAQAVTSSANTVAVHLVEATGEDRTVRVRSVTQPMGEWGLGGGVVSTAAAAAAAVRLLARGKLKSRGVVPPERCIEPDEMFGELERRGCKFELTTPATSSASPSVSPGSGGGRGGRPRRVNRDFVASADEETK
jgi:lysine 6-dehydrogenase